MDHKSHASHLPPNGTEETAKSSSSSPPLRPTKPLNQEQDHYSLLGVTQSASLEQIREAYKKLALRCHPDKNLQHSQNATSEFQRLITAWETLRDEGRRREYDRWCYLARSRRRMRREERENYDEYEAVVEDDEDDEAWDGSGSSNGDHPLAGGSAAAEWARWRKEEIDRAAKSQWEKSRLFPQKKNRNYENSNNNSSSSERNSPSPEEVTRLEAARRWRATARREYISRHQHFTETRQRQLAAIQHYQVLVRRYERQEAEQEHQSEATMITKFTQAIQITESSQGRPLPNHDAIIDALMEAKRVYTLNLRLACQATSGRLKCLLEELRDGRRRYEDEEFVARTANVAMAREILGSQGGLNVPLFSAIDRRRQALNYWNALARVRKPVRTFISLEEDEGPWHERGSGAGGGSRTGARARDVNSPLPGSSGGGWERIPIEFDCQLCERPAFHIMLDCGPARCPACGIIVCNDCHRDLEILREYEAWLVSESDTGMSLFSLEFEEGDEPVEAWNGGSRGGSGSGGGPRNENGIGRSWL